MQVAASRLPPLLIALGLLAGCSRPAPPPNVLLITFDTTRADRLGCYGYSGARTPVLDALARSGVRFEHAYAQAPLTLASHAALLTGTYPAVNGLHVNAEARLAPEVPTLAERLRAKGYRTGAFVSSFVLDAAFGLDRGFDVYDDELQGGADSARFRAERPANLAADAALAWLGRQDPAPFFAWVHFYDPHSPHEAPAEYAGKFANAYDAEIAFADAQAGRLIEWLRSAGLTEKTLVVVAGDHGEAFGEHDEVEHGLFVYDATVRVPLIVAWPGRLPAGETRRADVQLVDLYPTIVELARADAGAVANGESLVGLLRADGRATRPAYGESRYGQLGYGWAPLRYLVLERFKLIDAPRPELFDREADPGELHNLWDERPDEGAALRAKLEALEAGLAPAVAQRVDLDPASRAKLESLGYVPPAPRAESGGPAADPKDMLEIFRGHFRANGLIAAGRWDEAASLLETLVAASPRSYDLYEDLGWAYLSLGRAADAERAYRESLTALPGHAERLWGLAESLRRQNRLGEAIDVFQRSLVQRPEFGEAHLGLALAYAARGEPQAALEHAKRHTEINPGSTIAWSNLATLATQLGRNDEAVAASERLLALAPADPQAHYLHWDTLRAAGRRDEELGALRRAHQAFPDEWLFTCLLAWRLAVTPGQDGAALDEALELARQAVRVNPTHPRSFDTLAAAQAARGSFPEAVEAGTRALALLQGPDAKSLGDEIRARLALYRAGRPYQE